MISKHLTFIFTWFKICALKQIVKFPTVCNLKFTPVMLSVPGRIVNFIGTREARIVSLAISALHSDLTPTETNIWYWLKEETRNDQQQHIEEFYFELCMDNKYFCFRNFCLIDKQITNLPNRAIYIGYRAESNFNISVGEDCFGDIRSRWCCNGKSLSF